MDSVDVTYNGATAAEVGFQWLNIFLVIACILGTIYLFILVIRLLRRAIKALDIWIEDKKEKMGK